MKKTIERVLSVLKGVSTLDIMIKNTGIILLLFVTMAALGGAARGGHSTLDVVDPTFNPNIRTTTLQPKTVQQILPLPNGKALVAGNFSSYNGQPTGPIVRLNADGTLDQAFNSNSPYWDAWWIKAAFQTDGKILVLYLCDYPNSCLVRLNADGRPDPTYNGYWQANDFMIDASDRVILSGSFPEGNDYRSIIRLNPDGSRDPTFQFPLNQTAGAVGTQNNKIIITSPAGIQRLNEDGTLDPSFVTRNIQGWHFIVQPDRKILLLTPTSQSGPYSLRRLNENGSDDEGFTSSTFPSTNFSVRIALGEDGKIALAVQIQTSSDYQIRRLLADGTADSSFTPYTAARFSALAMQADGGVLIGDKDLEDPPVAFRNDFVRLLPNGSPDPNYLTGIGFQNYFPGGVSAITVQPDQKILIGGNFNHVNDVPRRAIARLNWNSTLDESFQINTSGTGNYFLHVRYFSNIIVQSDGKIVATGDFEYWVNSTTTRRNLVRLNSDGSIDPTFILGVGLEEDGKLGIFNDGKLLVGNSRRNGNPTEHLPVKLLTTGARDTSFNANIYPQDLRLGVGDVAIQPDGKILIGGVHGYSPGDMSYLTRLNADGSLDTTFQTRELPNTYVTSFVLLPNGKIVVAEYRNVLRLNPDGSVDPTFNAGTGANGPVNAMLLLSTGRILAGGHFTSFNGQPRGNLVQLNEDGSVFSPVYNVNGDVSCLAIDANGRVFVGGEFTTIIAGTSGGLRTNIAGLIDSTKFDFDGDGQADISVFRPSDRIWYLDHSTNGFAATQFGFADDKLTPADYDGDGKTDIAVFREGTWYWLASSNNSFNAFSFGVAGDVPVPANYSGDGRAELAVYREGVWWMLDLSNDQASAIQFGLSTDKPVAADYDGDGRVDQAVYRNGEWHINRSTQGYTVIQFGLATDRPVPADYDGDGKTDAAVYRGGTWYLLQSSQGFTAFQWGLSSDVPVPADYDGDSKTDAAVFRAGVWYLRQSTNGVSIQNFGVDGDKPVPAVYLP